MQQIDTSISQSNNNNEFEVVKLSDTEEELLKDYKDELSEFRELSDIKNNENQYVTTCIKETLSEL